ncbi:hypothetical protein CHISP_3634 [Chitinispirillum alkaliphilum]|nr:hypothetical protein CHISP_3634 [Chitinispirillum alkaliphilum]
MQFIDCNKQKKEDCSFAAIQIPIGTELPGINPSVYLMLPASGQKKKH